jgi:hypothetical protein
METPEPTLHPPSTNTTAHWNGSLAKLKHVRSIWDPCTPEDTLKRLRVSPGHVFRSETDCHTRIKFTRISREAGGKWMAACWILRVQTPPLAVTSLGPHSLLSNWHQGLFSRRYYVGSVKVFNPISGARICGFACALLYASKVWLLNTEARYICRN